MCVCVCFVCDDDICLIFFCKGGWMDKKWDKKGKKKRKEEGTKKRKKERKKEESK